jgi:AcrR family transcriptional regulator
MCFLPFRASFSAYVAPVNHLTPTAPEPWPQSGPRDELHAEKRERILRAAVALFYRRGFTTTTLDDIAHELGVTKPALYAHFRSKGELLAEICRPTIEMSLDAARRGVASPGCCTDRLRFLVVAFTQVIIERQPNIAVFFREEKHLQPAAAVDIDALRREFDRVLCGLLDEGVTAGEFHIADTKVAALAIGGMVSWAYTWHRPDGRLPAPELADRMAAFALGIAGVTP